MPHQSVVRAAARISNKRKQRAKILLRNKCYQGMNFFRPFFFFLLVDSVVGSAFAALPAVDSALVPVLVLSLVVPGELAAGAGCIPGEAGAAAGGVAPGFAFEGAASPGGAAAGGVAGSEFMGAGSAEPSGAGATVSAGGVSVPVPALIGTEVSDPAGTVSTATEFPDPTPPPPEAMAPGAADPGFKISTAEVASTGGCKFGCPLCAAIDTSGLERITLMVR